MIIHFSKRDGHVAACYEFNKSPEESLTILLKAIKDYEEDINLGTLTKDNNDWILDYLETGLSLHNFNKASTMTRTHLLNVKHSRATLDVQKFEEFKRIVDQEAKEKIVILNNISEK